MGRNPNVKGKNPIVTAKNGDVTSFCANVNAFHRPTFLKIAATVTNRSDATIRTAEGLANTQTVVHPTTKARKLAALA